VRWFVSSLLVFRALLGCTSAAPTGDTPVVPEETPAETPSAQQPGGSCPIAKLRFTQATGCLSDGSLEFCVPKEDRQLLERLHNLVPELRKSGGGSGRAGCDTERETLYFFDTRPDHECVGDTDALTDAAWEKVCRIAAESAIPRIVPTWYE